ncbi:MAG: Panacea domain-containing protein [Hyphomonadaceae bacterium]|nr:Panacea domain-containing protein [Hyphomonadaceae bacterium]
MRAKRNHNRLEQITHYVIARTPSDELGATKLNKVLWVIDLMSWRERAESLTGLETYRRLEYGPVPTQVKPVVGHLISSGWVVEKRTSTPVGQRKELISLVDPDLSGLSAEDIDLIHRAIDFIRPMSATKVSELTHDTYWEEVQPDGDMSVGAASIWPGEIDQDALDWAMSEAESIDVR